MSEQIQFKREEIVLQVISSLKNVLIENDNLDIIEDLNESTSLLGQRSVLDSLGLVTLLVDLEQRLEEDYDVFLTLADERAMSQKNSPFRTVQSLTYYICMLLEENLQSVGS